MTFRDIYALKPTSFGRAFVHDYLNFSCFIFLCGSTTVKLQWIDLNRMQTVLTRTQPLSRLFLSTFAVRLLPEYALYFLFYSGGL